MILLIDNYDSFSYNLYQLLGSVDPEIRVARNDAIGLNDIEKLAPGCVVLSPGPGRPGQAGICVELVRRFYRELPILGVCLGHQAIYEAFGGTVSYAMRLMHGKASEVTVDTENALFEGLPPTIQAARYHSLAGTRDTLPRELEIIAQTADGEIMAVCHKAYPVYGLQFHPESILTPCGSVLIKNFLKERKQ